MSPEEFFFAYRFTENGVVDDGSPLREHLRRHAVLCAFLEAGETLSFEVAADPGFLWFTNGPALTIRDDRTDETRSFAFEYIGTRSRGYRAEIAAGPVRVDFTNTTDERYALLVLNFPDDYEWTRKPFLSGAQLLSTRRSSICSNRRRSSRRKASR